MQCIRAKPKLPSRNDTKIARLRPYSKTLLNEKFRIHSTIVKFSYKRLFLILRTTKAESDHRAPAHRDCLRQPKTAKSEAKKNPNRNQIQTNKILLKTYKKKIAKPGVPPKKESSCKTSFPQCKLAILCFFEKRKVFKSHRPQDSTLNIYTHTYLYFHFSRAYT